MTLWASNTGSNVLTGLNVDAAAWQSGSTIRYTFSGSPNFSSVVAGYQLVISGSTNAVNDGTFEITDVNDTSDWIEVLNYARTSASADESSSPATGIVKQNAALVQEPTTAKQGAGFLNAEKPPAGYFNWLFNNSGKVQIATADIGYSTIASSSYTAIGGEGKTVLPYTGSAISQTLSSGGGEADITATSFTYTATASNRVLLGYSFSADSVAYVNADVYQPYANGVAADAGFRQNAGGEPEIVSGHFFDSAAAGTAETFKVTGTPSGNNITITSGKVWGVEFASTAAAGNYNAAGTLTSSSTTFANLISTVAISPTNNPVLLIANSRLKVGNFPTNYLHAKFNDGTNDYGLWLHGFNSSAQATNTYAWVTGDLNGSTTFALQVKTQSGDSSVWDNFSLTAIEITGDSKSAKPTGTCSITDTEATITDGSTSCSHSFTPGADIEYLALFTGYLERTAGTGYVTLKVKVGATELTALPAARETSADNKTPFTIMIPTGLLTNGASVTVSATALTSDGSTTYTIKSVGFFLVEAPSLTADYAGDAATATITNAKPGRVRVDWSSSRKCSADVALSYALYENVNSGGDTLVFEKTLTAPGTADQDCSISWLRPTDLTQGDTVVYTVKAKMASGSVVFPGGYLSATEVPSV